MKYYSLFYNACQARLYGGQGSGFGIRTVTEGTPKEVIDELGKSTLYRYSAGSYDTQLFEVAPERVNDYPRGYVFHRLGQTDYYLMARTAYIGYDIGFYLNGKPCRGGNYVVNLYAFEGWPGKKIFSLLQDNCASGCLQFLPSDCTPKFDNAELETLIVGKPQFLPMEHKPLAELSASIPQESIDIYFSYLEARGKNQPLVVRTKAADAARIAAGFMSLLPDDIARMTQFVLNYQEEGTPHGFAVTFINEYYQYEISPISCTFADLISGIRKIMPLESKWREDMEKEITVGGLGEDLSSWIYSQTAANSVSLSKEINEALYTYCHHPECFDMNMARTPGFLEALADNISRSGLDDLILNALVKSEIASASDASKVSSQVLYAGQMSTLGLLSDSSKNALKLQLAFIANRSVKDLSELFEKVNECELDRYMSKSDFPSLEDVALGCVLNKIGNTRKIMTYLEKSAENRVSLFVEVAKNYPETIYVCKANLRDDSDAAARIDYLTEFKDYYSYEGFADVFFGQLKSELQTESAEPRKLMRKFKMLADANRAFAKMLFSDSGIYVRLYQLFEPTCKEGNAADISLIRECVMDVIPEDSVSRKKWHLLLNVLETTADGVKVIDYYNLALKIEADKALRFIVPDCFDKIAKNEIADFIENIRSVFDERQIIEKAKEQNLRQCYLAAIAKAYSYDFRQIEALAPEFRLPEKEFSQFMKTYFPSMWKKQAVKSFFSGLFSRKSVKGDGETVKDAEQSSGMKRKKKK